LDDNSSKPESDIPERYGALLPIGRLYDALGQDRNVIVNGLQIQIDQGRSRQPLELALGRKEFHRILQLGQLGLGQIVLDIEDFMVIAFARLLPADFGL
jgi:hypothetical protein